MASGEVPIVCPQCQHRASVPVAAVKRDNYYCGKCFERIPMVGVRTFSSEGDNRSVAARPKKSSKVHRR